MGSGWVDRCLWAVGGWVDRCVCEQWLGGQVGVAVWAVGGCGQWLGGWVDRWVWL